MRAGIFAACWLTSVGFAADTAGYQRQRAWERQATTDETEMDVQRVHGEFAMLALTAWGWGAPWRRREMWDSPTDIAECGLRCPGCKIWHRSKSRLAWSDVSCVYYTLLTFVAHLKIVWPRYLKMCIAVCNKEKKLLRRLTKRNEIADIIAISQ